MEDFNAQFDLAWLDQHVGVLAVRRAEAAETKNEVPQSSSILGKFENIENAAISQSQREDKYGDLRATNGRINGMPMVTLNIFTKKPSSFDFRGNFAYEPPIEELQTIPIYKYPKHKWCFMEIQDDMVQSWRMIKTDDVSKEFKINDFEDSIGYHPNHEYQVVRLKALPIIEQNDEYRRSSSILIDACIISHNHYSVNVLIKLADTDICL